ncbi:MAG TPA: NAD-glutamate dehydrogenase domain-containing protein [Euzebyales bacterium]|nr:NAD-glutamate dehydrogenase domain-containing protein [Euzebyales bacterium]
MSQTLQPGDVVEQVEARLDEELRTLGADLARIVLRRHPHGLPEDPETRAAVVAAGTRLIGRRAPGELAVRVYNPDTGAGTMIAVVVEDAPFLMSTLAGRLERQGLAMANHAYPEFGVVRDDDGGIVGLRPSRGAEERQTWIHVELDRRLGDDRLDDLAAALRAVLDDVQRATGDFAAMRDRVDALIDSVGVEDAEAEALLRWLLDDHFVFLGAVVHQIGDGRVTDVPDSGLGIFRSAGDDGGPAVNEIAGPVPSDSAPLTVSLTPTRSTVHRHDRMVDVAVSPDDGHTVHRIVGLFAKKATAEPVTTIPVLRRWVDEVTADEDVVKHSHDERMLRSVLEALPKDALFTAGVDGLAELFDVLVRDERATIRVAAWTHPVSAAAIIVVAVPRSRFDVPLRAQIDRRIAERLSCVEVEPFVGFHEDQALLTYVLHVHGDDGVDLDEVTGQLRTDIVELSRTWAEQVHAEAAAEGDASTVDSWIHRLPATYRDSIAPEEAVTDCRELAALADSDADVRMLVERREREAVRGPAPGLRFKLYRRGPAVELSRFVPILESLGLVVVESVPHVLHPDPADDDAEGGPEFRIHDYGVRLRVDADLDVDEDGDRLADAASAIWSDRAEADSLNELVLLAGLHWLDVAVIRAYRQYRRQVGTTFSAQFQNDALCAYPEIARALMEYFVARFRPDVADAESRIDDSRNWLFSRLDEVNRLDQDRILRGYLELIDATVRTNRYREEQPARIALKFDPSAIPDMPKPVPFREIFVYSPQMEGVHLRGGPVARGGVRWSDRQEDFRTEVLGLMKAQMVKNAVIVPAGSKGGFVLKSAADDVKFEVRRQYESYIRGLFDVTDNIVDGEVRHPDGVRSHDDEDAYLVVAADRGTAALSDLANSISKEYGFWLGDAFASGGSQGYDHKDMGITARGAWVAVRHHFRELGIDVQTEPITITGIGDMSGDVFGNGLLQSRAVKLIAAFDHRDIMIDPDPDPETSYEERRRLFEKPGATWQDYDRDLLSPGGGVWSRTIKRIELTDEVRDLIRVDDESMTPPELIRALLRAPADLLFAGGIGTFVKASSERDADVGDRANDAVRVDADQVGARVIGEGGNLAVTQRGRMQYARRGGRVNLDAIDNAAGVDTSDREVNLKILLGQAIDAGHLEPDQRNQVLADVTDDVAERVLDDVAAQTRLISEESAESATQLDSYEQLMRDLEGAGRLDRTVEALPDAEEIERRQQAGGGLTRPELGLLIGYAKSDLAVHLADSDLPASPSLEVLLEHYFPAAITERFAAVVHEHRLRDELVAMLLANDLINHLGITSVSRTVHQLGCGVGQVAGAYWIARQVSGAADDWAYIEALDDTLEPTLQRRLKQPVDALVGSYTRRYASRRLPDDLQGRIERDRAAFTELEGSWPSDPPPGVAVERRDLAQAVIEEGVDEDVAWRLVTRPDLAYVPDVADIAEERDRPVAQVADAFIQVGRELPLDRIRVKINATQPEGHWQQWEQKTLLDELHRVRRLIARQAMDATPDLAGDDAVARLLDDRTQQVERVWSLLAAMSDDEDTTNLAQASVTMSALRAVLD